MPDLGLTSFLTKEGHWRLHHSDDHHRGHKHQRINVLFRTTGHSLQPFSIIRSRLYRCPWSRGKNTPRVFCRIFNPGSMSLIPCKPRLPKEMLSESQTRVHEPPSYRKLLPIPLILNARIVADHRLLDVLPLHLRQLVSYAENFSPQQ
jgi:hypothetical protein